MRVLLIQPPDKGDGMTRLYPRGYTEKARSVLPPLGLLSLAAHLKQRHDVYVVDMDLPGYSVETVLPGLLQSFNPDIVGVTAVIGLWASALDVLRMAKKCDPTIYTVVGGPNPTYYPEETLSHEDVDYVIVGNGQKPLMTLCDKIESSQFGEKIENCFIRGVPHDSFDCIYSQEYNTNKFPYPDRRFTQYQLYHVPFCPENPTTTAITSMGCPYRCIFCTQNRPPIQKRTIGSILDEMEDIQRLGIKSILFQDELLTLNKHRVKELCEGIIDRKIQLHWSAKSRVDKIRPWMPSLMKKAGCFNIHFGIESGNDATLARMDKCYVRMDVLEAVIAVKTAGLSCTGNFMLAYPGETEVDILNTIAFAKTLDLDVSQFSLTIDSPGSLLFEQARDAGRVYGDYFSDYTAHPDPANSGIPLEHFSFSSHRRCTP